MKKIIDNLINFAVKDCDTYYHNGSVWLISTDDKQWIIELKKNGTLWYNYYFFKNLFQYVSLEVVEHHQYITDWVENWRQKEVKYTEEHRWSLTLYVDDIIEDGIKSTIPVRVTRTSMTDDVIKNVVKEIYPNKRVQIYHVEDTILNGTIHGETKSDGL